MNASALAGSPWDLYQQKPLTEIGNACRHAGDNMPFHTERFQEDRTSK
jgi:hypothetical protein